eukprot:TRINITY_DN7683_c0_g1_i1.p1 TRINITY_DN7683_c0_g1~~TRINITY_DN7683_c0_g1_i1.p1  ORF type:complete len:498 (-),score=78.72 TRINITY_DN7683_c0_g1_i1:402-1895(-)
MVKELFILFSVWFAITLSEDPIFVENFDNDFTSRWKITRDAKFDGEWLWDSARQVVGSEGDKGLIVANAARHSAISAEFSVPLVASEGKQLVIQYEVKLQNKLECGGSYIKLLAKESKATVFTNESPYIIMFGPDRCGMNDRVHFIFRHFNPLSKTWEEKAFNNAPPIKNDRKSHVYTLIVNDDNSFEILIDLVSAAKGNLLKDFSPPVIPPKEIDDPDDQKPVEWVDNPKIPDPSAEKPDDWDEDAPREITDTSATKPADWDETRPAEIPDPNAQQPAGWDEEEDGTWEAPFIPNPDCEKGCGPWNAPKIPNPAFKGKWFPPKIDNPAYKGPWKARQIPNPHYFSDVTPYLFPEMIGVGIEIWSMQNGMMFDNFWFGHDAAAARSYAESTWRQKYAAEKLVDPDKDVDGESLVDNIATVITENQMLFFGILTFAVLGVTLLGVCLCGSRRKNNPQDTPATPSEEHEDGDEGDKEEEPVPVVAAKANIKRRKSQRVE